MVTSPSPPTATARRVQGSLLAAVREVPIAVGAALVLSLLVRTFLVQAFWVPSPSMERTLDVGDRILVSQLTPSPSALRRGDVVVFADPGGRWLAGEPVVAPAHHGPVGSAVATALTHLGVLPSTARGHLVKRVIGLPGDRVACCDATGRTTVNGTPITEDYLAPGAVPSQLAFAVTVPAGRLWVEGDNRQDSADSRLHTDLPGGGSVPERLVVGRAVVRVWPLDRVGWLSDHAEVFGVVPPAGDPPTRRSGQPFAAAGS